MATVQLAAWDGTHRGVIDAVSAQADEAIADGALARAMLSRRRAVTATVLDEFFAAIGRGFELRNTGQAHLDRDRELAEAAKAAAIAAAYAGEVGPLRYERALLARMEGRTADALYEYNTVLAKRPGFVAAAVEAARLSLAAGEPAAAVLALAPVEKEVRELRAGSGVLADALRTSGRAADATRYDLTALLATGHRDNRGNDCASDDLFGRPVVHRRMPAAFAVSRLPDGRFLMNDRGLYFIAPFPLNQLSLADLLASTNPKARSRTKSGRSAALASLRERLDFALTWIRLRACETALLRRSMFGRPPRFGATAAGLVSRAGRRLSRPVVSSVLRRVARRLFPAYKALPESCRALNRRIFLPRLLRWWGFFAAKIEMPDRDDQLKLVDLRRAEGIAQILGQAEPYEQNDAIRRGCA